MSFYSRRHRPQMGFVWLAPVVQLIGGALQSHPVDMAPPPPAPSLVGGILLGLGAVVVLGGLAYAVVKS